MNGGFMKKSQKQKSKKKPVSRDNTELWESRQLGASLEHAKLAPQEIEDKIGELIERGSEMKSITLRLPQWVIEQFKKNAPRRGLKYQTYMRMAIVQKAEEDMKRRAEAS
jgi:predicted DNA binding CopG/RHH family protein